MARPKKTELAEDAPKALKLPATLLCPHCGQPSNCAYVNTKTQTHRPTDPALVEPGAELVEQVWECSGGHSWKRGF